MPFTFSHPAIVLPLICKRWKLFSATGLIIGSITPDFESFIRLNVHKPYSHTWAGMFWFDLPLAVIIAFIFHNIVRDALIKNLPSFLGDKFARFIGFRWNPFFRKHFLMIIISMFIGILSHLLWDSFTHLNISNPGINASKVRVFNTQLHALLQDFSSIAGIIVIMWYIVRLPNNDAATIANSNMHGTKNKTLYWLLVTGLSLLTWVIIHFLRHPKNVILRIDVVITAAIFGLIASSLVQKAVYTGK